MYTFFIQRVRLNRAEQDSYTMGNNIAMRQRRIQKIYLVHNNVRRASRDAKRG